MANYDADTVFYVQVRCEDGYPGPFDWRFRRGDLDANCARAVCSACHARPPDCISATLDEGGPKRECPKCGGPAAVCYTIEDPNLPNKKDAGVVICRKCGLSDG